MKAVVYSFTRRGAMLSINIGEALQKFDFEVRCLTMPKFAEEKIFLEAMDDHNKACEYAFKECQLIVFVGAVGIAVRTIAPYIKNKLVDPAVLSVDEGGNFVIPLLSGHIGGANGFAKVLAKVIKATPVVTTATDVNKLFAVDEWAARNNMIINSMKAAKDFAAALVDGQEVGLFTDYPIISALPRQIVLKDKGVTGLAITKNRNVNPFDLTVQLWPRNIYLGIGCRRGTTLESIETLVLPRLKVTISAPEGVEIAKKTFNPRLGILGGISILGTSGIVEPMSEKALIETMYVEIDTQAASGNKNLLVFFGNYGEDFTRDVLGLNIDDAVTCSNFVGELLDYAVYKGFETLLLIGHSGKLVKLGQGVMNTHSKYADCRTELMALLALLTGAKVEVGKEIIDCPTTDEVVKILQREGIFEEVISGVTERIDFYMQHRVHGKIKTAALMFSNVYGILGKTAAADELIKLHLKDKQEG